MIKAKIRDKPTTLKKDLACGLIMLFKGSEPIPFQVLTSGEF
jgi:hypothetical protein